MFDTPLHRRDYKHRSCVGTLHPPLGAAMALLAGLRANSRVLDPFAGVGTLAIEARRLQPAASVTAADIDEARIRDAATNARLASARVDLACADGAHMPWRDGAFDRVVSNVPWARAVRVRGGLARTPERREREIARVLDEAGRAVLLVDRDDPVGRGTRLGAPLALLHRSWVSVFGQHPRLCVVVRDGAGDGVIDAAAPCGPALERWLPRADTAEIRPSPSPEIGSLPATAALSSHRR